MLDRSSIVNPGAELYSGYFRIRFSSSGHPYQVWVPPMPLIPKEFAQCVVYLFPDEESARAGERAGGTGFLVHRVASREDGATVHPYVVTCEHVVSDDPVFGSEATTIRRNRKDGGLDILETKPEEWFFDQENDLAIWPISRPVDEAVEAHSLPERRFVKQNSMKYQFSLGADAFILGRFMDHQGVVRNTPSVRFGQVSMLAEGDQVEHDRGHRLDSFLLDIRHLQRGYSGSPAFTYLPSENLEVFPFLLGVCWGIYPREEPVFIKGTKRETDLVVRRTSGMAAITPAWKLVQLLDRKDVAEAREAADRVWNDRPRPGLL